MVYFTEACFTDLVDRCREESLRIVSSAVPPTL
jgi:hypothetical protein